MSLSWTQRRRNRLCLSTTTSATTNFTRKAIHVIEIIVIVIVTDGIMVAYNYSQDIDSPANNAFKADWEAAFGDSNSIHEIAVSNYQGVLTWAEGVRAAGSLDRDAVIAALETGISIVGPGGKVTVDPKTHHAVLDVHLMEMENQGMRVVKTLSQRQPIDTQAVCDLAANPNDNTQYEIKF